MELSKELLDGFAEITHDKKEKITDVTCYGTANLHDGEYVQIDGANELTPASFAVSAHDGDRVMVLIKNHSATVIANITTPSMTLGILKVTDGIIVQGYLTTNSARTTYNDQSNPGLTFSAGGIGAYGGSSGKYWYVTNGGDLYASSAEIIGNITAESGYLGTAAYGFHIDQYGIYSGNPNKSGVTSGEIALSNSNFSRTLGGTLPVANLRFAIGGNFGVDDTGKLYAAGAQIAGDIIAYSGYIGTATNGFHINEYGIYSGTQGISPSSGDITLSTGSFERLINNLSVQNLRFAIGSNFGVNANGELYASNAHISGRFDATLGSIANWQIGSNAIYRSNTGTTAAETFDTAGILYFGVSGISLSNTFKVTSAGVVTATSGSIGGWKLDDNAIYRGANSVPQLGTVNTSYFGINGLWVSDRFTVDSVGNLHATNADVSGVIKATSGEIGSGTNKILLATSGNNAAIKYGMASYADTTNKGFYIGTDGFALGGGAFTVSSTGVLTTSSGYIAEWVINGRGLYSEKTVSNVTYRAGLQSVGSTDAVDSRKAFLVEQTSNSTTTDKFYVRYDGYLYASSANITGEITASRLTLTNGTKVSTNDISGLKPVATSGSFNDLNDKTGAITTDNIGGYFTTYSNTINASNILYRGDVTIEEIPPTDNSGVTTTRFTYKNTAGEPVTRETKTSANGEYILIDVPVGVVPTGRPTSSATVGILVDTTGFLKASNALIYGTIYATDGIFNGTIYAGAGEIGGWTIDDKRLYSNSGNESDTIRYRAGVQSITSTDATTTYAFYVLKDTSGTTETLFRVNYEGSLYAAGGGTLGNWTLGTRGSTGATTGSLYSGTFGDGTNGSIYFIPHGSTASTAIGGATRSDWVITAGNKFGVTKIGALYASSATVSGTITATGGTIGGWLINTDGAILKSSDQTTTAGTYQYRAYMNAPTTVTPDVNNAFSVQRLLHGQSTWENVFAVRYDGYLVATYGRIGGWSIDTNSIHYGTKSSGTADNDVTLMSSSTFTRSVGGVSTASLKFAIGSGFAVAQDGSLYAGKSLTINNPSSSTGLLTAGLRIKSGTTEIGSLLGYTVSSSKRALCLTTNGLSPVAVDTNNAIFFVWGPTTDFGIMNLDENSTSGPYISTNAKLSADRIQSQLTSGEAQVIATNGDNRIYLYANSDGQVGIYSYNSSGTGINIVSRAASATYPTFHGHARDDLALSGGNMTGSISWTSNTGGLYAKDSASRTFGMIWYNATNLWIGADSGDGIHHAGKTFISTGYDTSNSVGNDTAYIVVPSLSGSTWSHSTYEIIHSGGGTMTGALNIKNANINMRSTATKGTAPSSDTYRQVVFYDAGTGTATSTNTFGWFGHIITNQNLNRMVIQVQRPDTSSTDSASFTVNYPKTGSSYVSTSSTMILNKTTNAEGTSDNRPALIVGGAAGDAHLELDSNDVMAKASGTTTATLNLNKNGGKVAIGSGGLEVGGSITGTSLTTSSNIDITASGSSIERRVDIATGNTAGRLVVSSSNAFGLYAVKTNGTARNDWIIYMNSSGTVVCRDPDIPTSSDIRDKNVIEKTSDFEALTLLRNVDIVNFTYKKDSNKKIQNGVIAQQVRDVLVKNNLGYRSYLYIKENGIDDFMYDLSAPEEKVRYSIDYMRLVPLVWKGWQIHDGIINTHESRLTKLEKENEKLKAEIEALKKGAA